VYDSKIRLGIIIHVYTDLNFAIGNSYILKCNRLIKLIGDGETDSSYWISYNNKFVLFPLSYTLQD